MLNRKASEYLFYGSLVVITLAVILVRMSLLGNLNGRIADLRASNINLQTQINNLAITVEENQEKQLSHLYELYDQVPSYFSQTELAYFTIAQLELVGIDETGDNQRNVSVDANPTFNQESSFHKLRDTFHVVEVQVYFTTIDSDVIDLFIDALYSADQIFIVNDINYSAPDGENFIGVEIKFLAFYELHIEDAS